MIPGEIFPAAGGIVLNSQSSNSTKDVHGEKSYCIQSAGLNVLWPGERVSFAKKIQFEDRDITNDPSAILVLKKLGYMTSPVTVIEDKVIVGFDVPKLDEALKD